MIPLQVVFQQGIHVWLCGYLLSHLRRARLLAHSLTVLFRAFIRDYEAANQAHDQASVHSFHLGQKGEAGQKPSTIACMPNSQGRCLWHCAPCALSMKAFILTRHCQSVASTRCETAGTASAHEHSTTSTATTCLFVLQEWHPLCTVLNGFQSQHMGQLNVDAFMCSAEEGMLVLPAEL